jgi:hypothetical protein
MSTVAFNSVSGYTVGENPAKSIILANGDITTINFTANGVSNLGPIANVKITGGTSGQAITTDGSGNLTFTTVSGSSNLAAPMPYYIATASSYSVSANFQGLFATPITIDGVLAIDGILIDVSNAMNSIDQQVLFDSNAVVTGNVGFTFNSTTGNLGVPGNITTGDNTLIRSGRVTLTSNAAGGWVYQSDNSPLYLGANMATVNAAQSSIVIAGNTAAPGNVLIQSNLAVVGNVQTSSNIVWANSSNTTKAYQFYNSATTSIDTVFV